GGGRSAGAGSAGGADPGVLAELRRGGVAALVPARGAAGLVARRGPRLRRCPGGGDHRPVAAGGGAVRAGLGGRPAGQPGRDSLVEPGGGAAVAARHRAGSRARGCRRLGVAACGHRVLLVVAAVRMAGRDAAGAVVAAATGVVRVAAGAGRRLLAAAAARRAGQAAGAAAVVAVAVAPAPSPGTGQRRAGGAGRRTGTVGPGAYRAARAAVRHGRGAR